jgi:hypothetical protein
LLVSDFVTQLTDLPDNGGSRLLRNVWTLLPDHTAWYTARRTGFTITHPIERCHPHSHPVTRAVTQALSHPRNFSHMLTIMLHHLHSCLTPVVKHPRQTIKPAPSLTLTYGSEL